MTGKLTQLEPSNRFNQNRETFWVGTVLKESRSNNFNHTWGTITNLQGKLTR